MGLNNSKKKPEASIAPVNDTQSKPSVTTVSDVPPVVVTATPVPNWINESQFVEILSQNVPQFSEIRSFNAKAAMGAGENYATLMLRVKIEVELIDKTIKPVSFMMKVPHDSVQMQEMLKVANFFDVENEVYIDLIPKFEELYKSKGLDIILAPRAYRFKEGVKNEPKLKNTVLMYDLGQDGYKNVNRVKGLNVEQAELVLRKLAQYHAASAVYKSIHGPYTDSIMYGLFGSDVQKAMDLLNTMFAPTQKVFLENVKNYRDGYKYHKKLATYFEKMRENFISLGMAKPHEFNVINHGDCWANNLLFKFDQSGNLKDMLFVDFQNPRYAHPATDLLYFIMTSVDMNYKLTYFDYFIKYYHDQLVKHLKLLDYKERVPKLVELQMETYKYGCWSIMACYLVLPVVLLDPTESATFENFLGDTEAAVDFKHKMYTNKRYQHCIEQILQWLDNRGLLEIYEPPQTLPVAAAPSIAPVEQNKTKGDLDLDWLNSQDFAELIVAQEPQFEKIVGGTSTTATKPGDNYGDSLLKVNIEVQLKDKSTKNYDFVLKIQADSGIANYFPKELEVYGKYVPAFEQLYTEAGHSIRFSPRSYRFNKAIKQSYLLMENLQRIGFKMADRRQGLDLDHTKSVLKKLAQWHAASLKYKEQNGPYPSKYNDGKICENSRKIFQKLYESIGESFGRMKHNFNGVEEYAHKLEAYCKVYIDRCIEDAKVDELEFNVLNHGDLWINNVMFQHDQEGRVKEVYLIDHQVTKYGNPAQDLYFFLMTSPELHLKIEQFDYLIRYYHENLIENVQLLKYTGFVPNLKELQIILHKHPIHAAGTVIGPLSLCLRDPIEELDTDLIDKDGSAIDALCDQLYSSETYKKHFELLMPWINRRGLLDI
ncbi:PREDICTED: uncharacterized protein LOC108621704 [Drosophila arizonae]|uniref:Uncharacterized protein LOC108621704 n=1 Tax=Drosophila arizonae TaxID=7263 RepID=A0ABM1Q5C5_DROAR|nr:PREDICTED: uncharacterized protein LOC108621704 [Drosophila arizonae]